MSTLSDAERLRFERALDEVLNGRQLDVGVGVLSERTLHAVLKRYYEPYEGSREVRLGRYIADIFNDDGVIEIQTGALGPLKPKLAELLEVSRVTVVHPLVARRKLVWVDSGTGERSDGGTARRFKPFDLFDEIGPLREFVPNPNFRFHLLMVDVDEYREYAGFDRRGHRRRGERLDRIPNAIVEQFVFERPEDYVMLCPPDIPERFSSSELAKAAGVSTELARKALWFLGCIGAVEREKAVRGYTYWFNA